MTHDALSTLIQTTYKCGVVLAPRFQPFDMSVQGTGGSRWTSNSSANLGGIQRGIHILGKPPEFQSQMNQTWNWTINNGGDCYWLGGGSSNL